MTDDNKDKPESDLVPGGNDTPEKKDTSQEDARKKARDEELFGDLEDEEETPEEIRLQRNVLWDRVAEMEAQLDASQQEKSELAAKLDAQKAASALAVAKVRDGAEAEKAAAIEVFIADIAPVADGLGQKLNAIAKEARAADPKFDKLTQGIEKTLGQLTAAFNKFSKKPAAPQDEIKAETTTGATPKTPAARTRPVRENETPEEIKAERDKLVLQMADIAGKLGKSEQDIMSLTRQLSAQKTESEQALARAQNLINEQKSFALEKFVKEILPALDNFERGFGAIPAAQRGTDAKFEALAQDVEGTLNKLAEVFNKFGIKAINPKGEAFDSDLHEAISTDDSAEAESDTVISVAQKGYTLNGRVIRTAKVVVKP